MKKITVPMIFLILFIFLSGCGKTDTGDTRDDGNTGNTVNDADTGDTGDDGNTGNTGNTGNSGDDGNTGNSGDFDNDEIKPDEECPNGIDLYDCGPAGACSSDGEPIDNTMCGGDILYYCDYPTDPCADGYQEFTTDCAASGGHCYSPNEDGCGGHCVYD